MLLANQRASVIGTAAATLICVAHQLCIGCIDSIISQVSLTVIAPNRITSRATATRTAKPNRASPLWPLPTLLLNLLLQIPPLLLPCLLPPLLLPELLRLLLLLVVVVLLLLLPPPLLLGREPGTGCHRHFPIIVTNGCL
jgi:hypothetical protein